MRAWDMIGDQFPHFFIAGQQKATQGRTFRAWDVIRSQTGRDLDKIRQETGDCVAMSCRDVLNATQHIEIASGDKERFEPAYSPYLYATGRVMIGNNQLKGRGAGSLGVWQAKACQKYGVLPAKSMPDYSGAIADQWGDDNGSWRKWIPEGDDHLIKTTARITSWSQLVDALANGYLCTIASNLGFEMDARSDGYHRQRGSWSHQMGIWGLSDDRSKPWIAISNQWGDTHGTLTDFETGDQWPKGMIRCRPEDIESAYRDGEIFAYSDFDGFEDRSNIWDEWAMI
jgi:hypothetical protein